jgi:hypothetical protein
MVVDTPFLSIGVAEGDTTLELFRVMDAVRLSTDTIVVVNGGASQVRWYDPTGRFIRAVGRVGAGPGEFSEYGPGGMCILPPDQLLIADPIQRRANVFTIAGEFVTVLQVGTAGFFPSVQACFADGTLLGWHALSPPERTPGTIFQPTFIWSRLASEGSVLTELATLPAHPQYLLEQDDGTATYHAIPFTVAPSASAAGDAFYVTSGTTAVVERKDLNGVLQLILHWAAPDRVRSEDVYDRFRSYMLESQTSPERRAHWANFFSIGVDLPEQIAAVRGLQVDDAGNLWAERYRLPWDSFPVWDVFDSQGVWLTTVTLPIGLQVYQIGSEFVLGLSRDDMGVERIHLHALERGQ